MWETIDETEIRYGLDDPDLCDAQGCDRVARRRSRDGFYCYCAFHAPKEA